MDDNEEFYVNEINTFPGMTFSSLTADLWKATDNVEYYQLIDWLIEYRIEQEKIESSIRSTRKND